MLTALRYLPRLMQAVIRHLFAYGELFYAESVEALQIVRRRLVGLAVACLAGTMALGLGCLWIIAATWDGPNRLWAVGGLFLGFLLIALIGIAVAFGGARRAGLFAGLRAEWRADLQEIGRLDPSLVGGSGSGSGGTGGGRP